MGAWGGYPCSTASSAVGSTAHHEREELAEGAGAASALPVVRFARAHLLHCHPAVKDYLEQPQTESRLRCAVMVPFGLIYIPDLQKLNKS